MTLIVFAFVFVSYVYACRGCTCVCVCVACAPHVLTRGIVADLFLAAAYADDPDVHQQAVAALRGLSVNDANKMKIVQEGGLEPLTLLLRSMDIEIQREVCAALANLAYADENKYEIAKGGAVTPLIVRAQSEDMEVARQACGCLANLAEMPDNQVCAVVRGGFPSPSALSPCCPCCVFHPCACGRVVTAVVKPVTNLWEFFLAT